jgi:Predicted nucleotide-binding protein
MVSEKSNLTPAEVEELIELLFKRIDVVPRPVVLESLQEAARIMRDTDPDDAVYLAAALERDAQLWSDDVSVRVDAGMAHVESLTPEPLLVRNQKGSAVLEVLTSRRPDQDVDERRRARASDR